MCHTLTPRTWEHYLIWQKELQVRSDQGWGEYPGVFARAQRDHSGPCKRGKGRVRGGERRMVAEGGVMRFDMGGSDHKPMTTGSHES